MPPEYLQWAVHGVEIHVRVVVGGELLDRALVDAGLGVEVEPLQRLLEAKAGVLRAGVMVAPSVHPQFGFERVVRKTA